MIYKCKMCGGAMDFESGATVGVCEYCGTKQTLPRIDDERKANLFDRASHFRRNNEYDKAMAIYEQILEEDTTDAESYWSLILCRYGIEYVEDPATAKRVPTVNRVQYTAVVADEDYKKALEYADIEQKILYEEEAKKIDEIQKGILEISQKEEPFDIFICYKETDNSGNRTQDSVIGYDLYEELTNEGYKVFFSRVTLEDKLGTAYEPYIFAALNSSKVMVVIGTKPEFFNAPWVKNEWSRYLALIKSDKKKSLIPVYKGMDPYDLPEEFSHLQGQDMGKIGAMQDLVRGIKKIVSSAESQNVAKGKDIVVNNVNVEPLLERVFMFLEDRDWTSADEYCERVLDQDPKNAKAYLGKLMAELKVGKKEYLKKLSQPFSNSKNYAKVIRFADESLVSELTEYNNIINERNWVSVYNQTVNVMNGAKSEEAFKSAARSFRSISSYKDSAALAEQCDAKAKTIRKDIIYRSAVSLMNENTIEGYEKAISALELIAGWQDADEKINVCRMKKEKLLAKQEAERLEFESKISAIANALKAGFAPKKAGTSRDKELESVKAKIAILERIKSTYSQNEAQVQNVDKELENITLKEKQLTDRRSKLGLFAGKEKKLIDEELSALSSQKTQMLNQKETMMKNLGGYRSFTDVEIALDRMKAAEYEIIKRTEREQPLSTVNCEYSFAEALKAYEDDPAIESAVNKIYPQAGFMGYFQGKTKSVKFGNYIQKNGGVPTPIEWIVLARENNRMLLISKYAIDSERYCRKDTSITWEICMMRTWLNSEFFNGTFSYGEKRIIEESIVRADMNPKYSTSPGSNTRDKVFLLSINEVNRFFSSDEERQCIGTEYCFNRGVYKMDKGKCSWWLRTPGNIGNRVAFVDFTGEVSGDGRKANDSKTGVRPAIWVNLEA